MYSNTINNLHKIAECNNWAYLSKIIECDLARNLFYYCQNISLYRVHTFNYQIQSETLRYEVVKKLTSHGF